MPISDDNQELSAFLQQKHTLKEWFHIQMLIEVYLISSPSPSIDTSNTIEKTLRRIIKTLDSREKKYYEKELEIIDDFFAISSIQSIKKIYQKKKINESILSFNAIIDCNVTSDIIQFISNHSWQDCFLIRIMEITSIPFSAGERAILELFSQLSFALSSTHNESSKILSKAGINNNVLLLVDEADLYLNPEWQRIFIDIFHAEITRIFKGKKVHIIMTTHSPIILSDFTSSQVIALKNGQREKKSFKTFGSNIHTLFKDNFFLESTIGYFSNRKISEVIEKLDKNKPLSDTDTYVIEEIGEPLIKNLILQRIKTQNLQKFSKADIEEKIRELENENLSLKNKIEEMEDDKN